MYEKKFNHLRHTPNTIRGNSFGFISHKMTENWRYIRIIQKMLVVNFCHFFSIHKVSVLFCAYFAYLAVQVSTPISYVCLITSSWTPENLFNKCLKSEESCEKQGWMAPTEAQFIVYKLSTWTDTQIFSARNKKKVLLKQENII